ncbi:MAG TPA: BTAD domain-containing putative transcriptional regulator [Actinoplanes sp.]|jgi:DNA-binding SARP family transcriptional activator/tetratricopeptide (TPR) repeat protein|nr:BTAD domain-containing putative transcriptional regulator [Actinoplanes sp.]
MSRSEFRLLGPVEMWRDGRRLDAGPRQQRTTLAVLSVEAGRLVTLDGLVDRVWGDAPPDGARQSLYAHIARIRRLLDPGELVSRSGGYLLDVAPDRVDLHRFRRLLEASRDPARTDAERAALLSEALGSWRGEPLAGVPGEWATRVRQACERHRLDAVLAWAEATMRQGDNGAVIRTLADLVEDHPMVEPLTAALMRALHAAGRTAEALAAFATTRSTLAEELGTDPGVELTELHQRLLQGAGERRSAQAHATRPVPAQLPMDVPAFAGRRSQLAILDEALAVLDQRNGAPVVALVVGSAGTGKTVLAVHWARRVAGRFPDGQLFVDLHGYHPAASSMSPAEALRGFLDTFAVEPQRIPIHLHAQSALFRSMLEGRRMLVLLDNARSVEQVRPLVPGSPGCLVIVTSRNRLTGLVAAECARAVALDVLPPDEAHQLLAGRLGDRRLAAEPDAAREIVDSCARLPLALAVVAARTATHRGLTLGAVAAELRHARHRLDVLAEDEDPTTDVRAAFSWSYRQLGPAAARMFRLLGLHPGRSIGTTAAASLFGAAPQPVRPMLAELTRVHLVAEGPPDRFSCHDLLRAYAAELAESVDPKADRDAAVRRVLDHYLTTATTADRLLYPHRDRVTTAPSLPEVTAEPVADERQATAWFSVEYPNLLAAIAAAASAGLDGHAWQLAWTLITFQDRQGLWTDLVAAQQAALQAAIREDDHRRQAHVHRDLGFALARLGRYDEACAQYRMALGLFADLGDKTGQARAHRDIGFVAWRQEREADALHHLRQALVLSGTAGHRAGRAYALNAVGMHHFLRGDYRRAVGSMSRALRQYQEIGDRVGEAVAWECLGHAHCRLLEHDRADACFRRALDLRHTLGDRYLEADTLRYLGRNHQLAGDQQAARRSWRRALGILHELGHPDAELVRAALDADR